MPGQTDVFVIGGGPAGLAAAIACRTKGFRVVLADPGEPPIDKSCGEGLMPDCIEALGRLGISVNIEEGFPFRGIRFLGETCAVEANFPRGRGMGVRRTALHRLLVEKAVDAGVELRWNSPVSELPKAGWVVGADGQNSRVRRWAKLGAALRESKRYGFRRHYRMAPWAEYVEIYWGSGAQIYVTPVAPDEVCVALLSRDPHLRLDAALRGFPGLARKLEGAVLTSSERGAVTATRRLKRVASGKIALVGDASGSVDAITGDGLCLSFKQAASFADALASGDLALYETAHPKLMRRAAAMGSLMLLLDRFGGLRRRVLPALAARPAIFSSMVAMHVGETKPIDFVMNAMLPLGWRMLHGSKA